MSARLVTPVAGLFVYPSGHKMLISTLSHNISLVAISVVLAIASAYTSLEHIERFRASKNWLHQKFWLAIASVCMGGGIWTMHFVGMMAVRSDSEIRFDMGLTALSLFVPIAVVMFAYHFVRKRVNKWMISICGFVMGQGIFLMHYAGMAAIRIKGTMIHAQWSVAASLFIAVAVSIIALRVAFGKKARSIPNKAIGAILLGLAISGMHYTAMSGTLIRPPILVGPDFVPDGMLVDKAQMALAVTSVTIAVLFSSIIAGMSADAAARKQHNEHMELLINELNHRVKNTLATVQGLARHSLKGVPEHQLHTFEQRLISLANAHTLLTNTNWTEVSIKDLITSELVPYIVDDGPSYSVLGPDIKISPRTALSLELAIHELTTNAVKYGALSTPNGHLGLEWGYLENDQRMFLKWIERGGPRVKIPNKLSFGSRLIERTIMQLNGKMTKEFKPDGLTCRFEFDIDL